MKDLDLKTIIADHPFLEGMTPEHLDLLARHAREAELKAGQVVLPQSQSAYQFYLMTGGKMAVESRIPRADALLLQVVNEGDVLGWSWLFPPFNWHFQARALEPSKAIVLDGASLLVACENDHSLGFELMTRLAQVVVNRSQAARKRLVQLYQANSSLAAVDDTRSIQSESGIVATKTLETQLSEQPFFRDMKRQHLAMLAASAMPTQFAAGQLVFCEGEIANRFYLIQRGKVLLQVPQAEGRAVPIQVLGDSDVLGWSWLFPPFYWHFDARALEPTNAIFFYGTRLRDQCEADHDFGYELMKRVAQVLIHRLQATRAQLLELHASHIRAIRHPVAQH